MQKASPLQVPTETQIRGIRQSQAQTIDALKHHLEWFKRQMFGTKSERLAVLEDAQQRIGTRSLNLVPTRDTSRILMYIVDASSFSRITAAL
jgi:predicted phage tail protein